MIHNFSQARASLLKPRLELEVTKNQFNLIEKKFKLPEFYVKGVYISGWVAGMPDRMEKIIEMIENTPLNSVVIDIKDEHGYISYKTRVEKAWKIGAVKLKIKNIKMLLKLLKSKGIYTIGRVVVFKDPVLAKKRPDLALDVLDPLRIKKNIYWVDPTSIEVWRYNIEIAKEAARLGFDEIQFDYIRYPVSRFKINLKGPYKYKLDKTKPINSFISYAKKELSKLSTPVSIDVFGLTTAVEDDLGIGQNLKYLGSIIDIISPMVYPSHYAPGSYGIEDPEMSPYKIVYNSMKDALDKFENNKVVFRPWLQDFSLKKQYSHREVMAQIRAVQDLGLKEWLLWNPRCRYTEKAFRPPLQME
ncbi:putative glycoside hydrolase [Halothermothrix orenii]|nr:putative glycoside hydrolase [Halothermothrix orenii]